MKGDESLRIELKPKKNREKRLKFKEMQILNDSEPRGKGI
jgi:hypothetical protein